ncbi:lipopolysaccharide-induced TNF-alpha factor [Elysia marginata]|uniref:Lipopolysaccharide-induced TNF-alpha factor n=1 Tax=Elysia marginata TaxID=1093978 RepID=A0AAV4I2B8_9GAST|nr:lipopolysaccharide-induced TNF-alpha factor [Elysia marginata]
MYRRANAHTITKILSSPTSKSYSDPSVPGAGYSQTGQVPQAWSQGYSTQPQQPYTGGYVHGTTTVVVTQPQLAVTQMFRECPVHCICPHCRAEVQTATHYVTGTLAWVLCFVIFIVGGVCCCFIPFCMDSAKDVVHTCPSCRQQIGRYNRM